MFAQYRFAMVWAIPVGALIGILGALLIVIFSFVADNTAQLSWTAWGFATVMYAAIGALIALAGLLGGLLTVWLADRRSQDAPRVWVYGGSLGATGGVLVLFLLVGAIGGIGASTWWGLLSFLLIPGIIAAIVTCVAATILLDKSRARFAAVAADTAQEVAL